jgi:hypothetical protein
MKVFGGMFVLGGVATSYVTATQTQTKMHPAVTHLQAFFTTSCMRLDVFNLIEMGTLCH